VIENEDASSCNEIEEVGQENTPQGISVLFNINRNKFVAECILSDAPSSLLSSSSLLLIPLLLLLAALR